jgi:hypothetical protein
MAFTTHTGEIVTGERLQITLNKVADDWAQLAEYIRNGSFAEHITELQKDVQYNKMIKCCIDIREGVIKTFTIWQRINTAITGECVALFK